MITAAPESHDGQTRQRNTETSTGLDFGMVDTSSPKGQVSTKPGQLHYAYLRHVFTELPKAQSLVEVEALLPTRLDSDTLTRHSLQGPLINPRQ